MSAYVTGAAISATSAALGYGANALREHRARREAARASRSAELHQALREYMAAIDASMMEVEDFPIPLKMTALDRWVERRLQGTLLDMARHIIGRSLKRLVYGHRHNDLSDRLVAAAARLRLAAPPQIASLMSEVEELARDYPAGDPRLMEHWRPLRKRIHQEFQCVLDGESCDRRSSLSHADRLRVSLRFLLGAHKDKEQVDYAAKRNQPSDPRPEIQGSLEPQEPYTEGAIEKAAKPLQKDHDESVGRAYETEGASRNDSEEKGFGERPLRALWLPVAVAVTWLSFGSISLASNATRHTIGLGLVIMGIITTLLMTLPTITGGVKRVIGALAGTATGLGGLLLGVKVSSLGTSPRWDIDGVAFSAAAITTVVLLVWLAVHIIARRFRHP